jgi:hypothetical protein
MDSGDNFLPGLKADLLSESIAVDMSWMTKITEEMAKLGNVVVTPIALPDVSKLDIQESIKAGIHTMASRGWTIQMSLTLRDLEELANQTPEEADDFFVAFYSDDNFAALRKVREELTSRPSLVRWEALLDECFESFESGRYLITIPALLSIIEGVIASAGAALTSQRVRLVAICAENSQKMGGNTITAEMWNSMKLFVEKLFERAPFDGARLAFINRHWILHGRDSASWTVADALRLFNALQTVDSLLV